MFTSELTDGDAFVLLTLLNHFGLLPQMRTENCSCVSHNPSNAVCSYISSINGMLSLDICNPHLLNNIFLGAVQDFAKYWIGS
jgi:hypothetical protein